MHSPLLPFLPPFFPFIDSVLDVLRHKRSLTATKDHNHYNLQTYFKLWFQSMVQTVAQTMVSTACSLLQKPKLKNKNKVLTICQVSYTEKKE